MRWNSGKTEVDALLERGELQQVRGGQANGQPWLDKAARTLKTAEDIVGDDPDSAFVLAYDAARHACTGLLTQQGLRPTSRGGHYVLERAVRAQFGRLLADFGSLRRRRNELEYPAYPGEDADLDEARAALERARVILDSARRLLPELGLY